MSAFLTRDFWRMRELTGLHVLTFAICFFGVIIAVNISMAVFAATSWSGLMAKNGYVASIDYAAKEKALDTLGAAGLDVAVTVKAGTLAISLDGAAAGVAVSAQALRGEDEAVTLPLTRRAGGMFEAPLLLTPGLWMVAVTIGEPGAGVTLREPLHVMAREETGG